MIIKYALEILMEHMSEPGEVVAEVLSTAEYLEDMMEAAECEDMTDAGVKKFAIALYEAYAAEEREHLMSNLKFMFDG